MSVKHLRKCLLLNKHHSSHDYFSYMHASIYRCYFEVLHVLGTGFIEDVGENKTWFLISSR